MTSQHPSSRNLPDPIRRLTDLAINLRWSWDRPTRELFADLAGGDPDTVNPIHVLLGLSEQRLAELAADEAFVARLDELARAFDAELTGEDTWFRSVAPDSPDPLVAYFSAEFGVSEALPVYAGGLGVLAGDHLKSASVLGLPLVGVGLFYYEGYFRQMLDSAGWQHDEDLNSDPERLPITLVRNAGGEPLMITVELPDRLVKAQIWKAMVGSIPLYLLDTRLPENRPQDQAISGRLYGGDLETRISQEVVLGVGGCRALEALGLEPPVYHMNEGHSAFLALERMRSLMARRGISLTEARAITTAGTVFTTHTPVAAGHDYFPSALMRSYFRPLAQELGLEWQEFMALGRANPNDQQAPFGMTILAMRMSSARNGVSKLHGQVTREMWANLWPGTPVDELPIEHITNGVHMQTWIAKDLAERYDQHIGTDWRTRPTTIQDWEPICAIPEDELWGVHQGLKLRLVEASRERVHAQRERRGATEEDLRAAREVLDPEALTIGFARRFTAYKRATLLFTDVERLAGIVQNADRPVQFIFAGKAHPRDEQGKLLIQRIASVASRPPFVGRVLFLEDYDMAIARHIVQGVDVWLNNPIRPQEASGTSGMKAAANGVLNFSVLDGWWDEAWQEARELGWDIGWSIDAGQEFPDQASRDRAEATRLYEVLEQEIIPLYYQRDEANVPVEWVQRMKRSINLVAPRFSANRMVSEYTTRFYLPAAGRVREASGN